jgi:hypothetical protein
MHRLLPALALCGCPPTVVPFLQLPEFGPNVELTALDDVSFGDALAVGDFDGDGEVDLAVSRWDATGLFRGPFVGGRAADEADVWLTGEEVASGDIDEDGVPELFTVTANLNPVVHAHRDAALVADTTIISANIGIPLVTVADVHGGARPDLVVGAGGFNGFGPDTGSRLLVFESAGWEAPRTSDDAAVVLWASSSAERFHALDAGDVTGDGRPELLFSFVGFNHSHESYLIEAPVPAAGGDEGELEGAARVVFGQSRVRLIGDIDGDGLEDLAGPSLEGVQFWAGGVPDPEAPDAVVRAMSEPVQSEVQPAGDLDGDGFGDAVVVDRTGVESMLFLGPIEGDATPARILSRPELGALSFELSVPVPDLDGDGGAEVLLGQAQDWFADAVGVVWLYGLP